MSRDWQPATRTRRCTICDSTSWCAVSSDGRVRKCMKDHTGPGAVLLEDSAGHTAAYYFDDAGEQREPRRAPKPEKPEVERAPTEVLDTVYRQWLSMMPLSAAHREGLRARGLNDTQIDIAGYRTGRAGLARALLPFVPVETLRTIPGLWANGNVVGDCFAAGLWIPVRDHRGRIVAIKIRLDDPPEDTDKYRWLSSTSKGGPGPSAMPHAPIFGQRGAVVRVTEGPLKADVCSMFSGIHTIAIPGATMVTKCLPLLQSLGAKSVLLAWDADVARDYGLDSRGKQKRNYVASGLERAMHLLGAEGIECAIEYWDEAAGKGLDDVLAAGNGDAVRTVEGIEAWDRVVDNLIAGKTLANSDTLTKCSPEALARYQAAQPVVVAEPTPADKLEGWIEEALASDEGLVAKAPASGLDAALAAADGVEVRTDAAAPAVAKKGKPPGDGPPRARAERTGRRDADFERGDEVELAERLLRDLREGSSEPILFDRNKFWRFSPGDCLWHELSHPELVMRVASYAGMTYGEKESVLKLSASKIDGTIRMAQAKAMQVVQALDESGLYFDNAPRGIATKLEFIELLDNGTLRVEPLRASHRQTVCLPFKWDENATAPKWARFYDDIFQPNTPVEAAAHIENLDEMVGACLFGIATRFQKCFVLLGEGSNGKGVWLKTIRRLFPAEYVCAQAPQMLIRNQFSLASIVGKRVNLVGELPVQKFLESATIKSLIAGDEMETEKKRVDSFKFVPQAGHIFLSNQLSETSDTTHGWMRRFVIVGFERVFKGSEVVLDLDKQLAEELPGIFARVVAAVQRLVKRGAFLEPASSSEEIEEWKYASDPVFAFVQDCCVEDKNAETTLAELHTAYARWCEQTKQRVMPANTFGGQLKKLRYRARTATRKFYRLRIDPNGMAGSLARRNGYPAPNN